MPRVHPSIALRPARRAQRGAATLAIVLMLSLVAALSAAYASRNTLFEQRSAANAQRAAQAQAAAEAGLEWAVAMLSSGRVDGQCRASAEGATPSLRQRLMSVDGDGRVAAVTASFVAGCALGGEAWACRCDGTPAEPAVAAADPGTAAGSFRLQFNVEAGALRVRALGCSDGAPPCTTGSTPAGAQARASVLLARLPALATVPPAALTVRGSLDAGGQAVELANADTASNGLALRAGGALLGDAQLRLSGAPGSPAASAQLLGDPTLQALSADRHFVASFGLPTTTWQRQPVVHRVDCPASGACGSALTAAAQAHPGRPLWVAGDLRLDAPIVLGDPAAPVLLQVDGALQADAPAALTGLLYLRGDTITGSAALQVEGAVVAEGDLRLTQPLRVRYSASALVPLQRQQGSLVRVPGSWRDADPQ